MDPLQFVYQDQLGVDDAIIYLLHRAHSHLERPGDAVRVMFFDFSSVFNTIQPLLLVKKLSAIRVNHDMVAWIGDYLYKFKSILGNPSHPLHAKLWQMGSTLSHRLISPRCKTALQVLLCSGGHLAI